MAVMSDEQYIFALSVRQAKRITELETENKRLRKAIQEYLDGNYEKPRQNRPGKCRHDIYYCDTCENCIDEYFQAVLTKQEGE